MKHWHMALTPSDTEYFSFALDWFRANYPYMSRKGIGEMQPHELSLIISKAQEFKTYGRTQESIEQELTKIRETQCKSTAL